MENVILILFLLTLAGGILFYILRAKKRGQKCIGCPYAKSCGKAQCTCGEKEPQNSQSQDK